MRAGSIPPPSELNSTHIQTKPTQAQSMKTESLKKASQSASRLAEDIRAAHGVACHAETQAGRLAQFSLMSLAGDAAEILRKLDEILGCMEGAK